MEEKVNKYRINSTSILIKPEELYLYIEGVLITIKVKDSTRHSHIKFRHLVSCECANVFQLIKQSVEQGVERDISLNFQLELEELELEILYRGINILGWQEKNSFIISIVNKIRMTLKEKINRLKVLEGALDAGHTNIEILEELLDLYQDLSRNKFLPDSHARKMSKNYSNLFLTNLKKDEEAKHVSTNM